MPADMIEVFESYGENGTAGERRRQMTVFSDEESMEIDNRGEWNRAPVALQWNGPPTPGRTPRAIAIAPRRVR